MHLASDCPARPPGARPPPTLRGPMRLPTGLARVGVLVTTAALLVGGALGPTPASAGTTTAAPVPKARAFVGTVADDFPRWERESSCSPIEKPGAAALRKLLRKTYGKTIGSSTVRACSKADSGHEEGRAVDWMTNVRVPAQKALAEAFVAWLQAPDANGNAAAMARRLGIEYVIWNNRTWRTYDTARGWTEYAGCLAKKKRKKKFDNTCHRTHVHISLSWDGAYQRTSYYSRYVACPWFPTRAPAPALPVDGLDFVAVPPVRLLATATGTGTTNGLGTPTQPCRARGGARYDLPVLGREGLPTSGIAAVVLRVGLVTPDSATTLRVWPTGGPLPVDPIAAANPGQPAALVTVPLGTGGMVSLQHSGGMSHLSADVVGYYLSPGLVGDRFHAVSPTRLVSARTVAPGGTVSLDLAGATGLPQVHAGLLSVTAARSTAAGGVTAYAPDSAIPPMPALEFAAGDTVTGSVLARTGPEGSALLRNTSKSPVTLTVDLQGVYAPAAEPGGLQFVPVRQARLVNTLKKTGIAHRLTAGVTETFASVGRGGVPATGVGALLLYGMAVKPAVNTSTTLWTDGLALPGVRQLSPRTARPTGDMLAVRPGATGRVAVRNQAGTSDLVVDVAGYFR
jgi:hypothetical protein